MPVPPSEFNPRQPFFSALGLQQLPLGQEMGLFYVVFDGIANANTRVFEVRGFWLILCISI
jgi:hypothetical protein